MIKKNRNLKKIKYGILLLSLQQQKYALIFFFEKVEKINRKTLNKNGADHFQNKQKMTF